jgi:hypothetical protein
LRGFYDTQRTDISSGAVLDDLEERLTNLQRRFEAEEDYRMEQVEQNE